MSKHYTAVIKITETETPTPPARTESYPRNAPPVAENAGSREVREVVNLAIRADSIEALITKATAHLTLVED